MLEDVWTLDGRARGVARRGRVEGAQTSARGGRCRTTSCTSPRSSAFILGRPAADRGRARRPPAREERHRTIERAVDRRRAARGPAPTRWPSSSRGHRRAHRAAPRARRRRLRRRLVDADGPGHGRASSRRSGSSTRGCTSRTCAVPSSGPATSTPTRPRFSTGMMLDVAAVRRREEGGGSRRFHRRVLVHRPARSHRRGGRHRRPGRVARRGARRCRPSPSAVALR